MVVAAVVSVVGTMTRDQVRVTMPWAVFCVNAFRVHAHASLFFGGLNVQMWLGVGVRVLFFRCAASASCPLLRCHNFDGKAASLHLALFFGFVS